MFRGQVDLEAVLPRVAVARDDHLGRAENLEATVPVVADRIQIPLDERGEALLRARALQGDLREVVAAILEHDAGRLARRDPIPALREVRGVDDHETGGVVPVDRHVVDHPPLVVAEGGVEELAGNGLGEIVGDQFLDEGDSTRPLEPEATHVGDIEETGVRADDLMLPQLTRRVLDGHLPSGKPHQLRAPLGVVLPQGGSAQFPTHLHLFLGKVISSGTTGSK